MRRKSFLLMFLLIGMLAVSACGKGSGSAGDASSDESGEYPYGHYEDDKMIGTAWAIDKEKNILELDISEWRKRDWKGPDITSEGYAYFAGFSDDTSITYEGGATASIDDIKKGQKILVNPPAKGDGFEGHADEIMLLDMTYEEKYGRLLSHIYGFNIVVMYEYGNSPPPEMQEPLYEEASTILSGTDHDIVGAYIEYDPNYVVDFKEELDIEQFPVIFFYDQEELLFKSYDTNEFYEFLKKMKAESPNS
ncbi:hypothetical protein [Planococcus halotolerans]|uniref:Uncharacterized protein n=1 Tax=Planococcus halotolerans TaxID=2233542 RepID=A0A365KWY5_9BACL|nr:hypothetical protein [Planococcus halotolerans]QHJ69139.1 hypothetical protein DNR44_000110 [Planococcus halotolerans]RAZ77660.1 hypothetical protein DP120_09255 [Planococcus halotolerans]